MKTGIEHIALERQRQIEVEGYTAEHDATHDGDELAYAACAYALPPQSRSKDGLPIYWPFHIKHWKPSPDDRITELIKAGALIAAEIDRIIAEYKPSAE